MWYYCFPVEKNGVCGTKVQHTRFLLYIEGLKLLKAIKITFICTFGSLLDSWKIQLVRDTASAIKWSANETFELDLIQK